jgi:ribosome maturation factor RimP
MAETVETLADSRCCRRDRPFGDPERAFFLPRNIRWKDAQSVDALDSVKQLAAGVIESLGLELIDVEMFRAGRHRMVRIYVGSRVGVSIDQCAKVSRDLSALLDAENPLGQEPYHLEVSSPGLDRPLKTLADYRRNEDKYLKVTCKEKVEGRHQWVGRLASVDETGIHLTETGSVDLTLPFTQIALAKVDVRIP